MEQTSATQAPPPAPPPPPPPPRAQKTSESRQLADHPALAKFLKMVRVGVAEAAVRQFMQLHGFASAHLDTQEARAALAKARGPSASEEEARALACTILGLPEDADVSVDGPMFREMLVRTHPDKVGTAGEGDKEVLFTRVKAAYDDFRTSQPSTGGQTAV